MKTSLIFSSIVSVLVAVFLTLAWYPMFKDVDALIDRAQIAADRGDMEHYLTQLKKNMEKHGMTEGYTAVIFTAPNNNLALHFKTVTSLLGRLKAIKTIAKNATAYQVALDDMRGTIREIPNPAEAVLWTRYWYLFYIGFGVWIWPLVLMDLDDLF